jgi:hypothetical protein
LIVHIVITAVVLSTQRGTYLLEKLLFKKIGTPYQSLLDSVTGFLSMEKSIHGTSIGLCSIPEFQIRSLAQQGQTNVNSQERFMLDMDQATLRERRRKQESTRSIKKRANQPIRSDVPNFHFFKYVFW